ncbi:MAG TPA: hypothetical protein VMU99_10535 [Acidimicrobiales bacterium]|nr:hypothetical protein [Acidimicrobiales bacterium]
MTNSSEDYVDHDTIFRTREQPDRVRATSTSSRHTAAYDRPQATVATAEIPVIRSQRQSISSARYANTRPGTRPQMWTSRPEAAPAPLRLFVWTLLFIFILMMAGFVTVLVHPTWLSSLRNVSTTPHALAPLTNLGALLPMR